MDKRIVGLDLSDRQQIFDHMVLYPQTGEQQAVAKRTAEIGAGIMLTDDSANGIRTAVQEVLGNSAYAAAAKECSLDFRSCSGTEGAAEFIENAPHTSESTDMIQELNKANGKFMAFRPFVWHPPPLSHIIN